MNAGGLARGPLQPLVQFFRARNYISTVATNGHAFFRPAVNGGMGHTEELGDRWPTPKIGRLAWYCLWRFWCALACALSLHRFHEKRLPRASAISSGVGHPASSLSGRIIREMKRKEFISQASLLGTFWSAWGSRCARGGHLIESKSATCPRIFYQK